MSNASTFVQEIFPLSIPLAGILSAIVAVISGFVLKSTLKNASLEQSNFISSSPMVMAFGAEAMDSPDDHEYQLLKVYHKQGLSQSKISFIFSLFFAGVGFIVILNALSLVTPQQSFWDQSHAFVTLTAGTVIEAVSALFFVQSNKSRQLMVEFFDRLRSDRKLKESLALASGLADKELQSRLYTVLSLSFADRKISDELLASILQLPDLRGRTT